MPNTTQNAPTNVEEIATSMQDTVLGIWADFVNHSPFLVMGALILLFTWGISALAARLMDASLRHSKMRGVAARIVRSAPEHWYLDHWNFACRYGDIPWFDTSAGLERHGYCVHCRGFCF